MLHRTAQQFQLNSATPLCWNAEVSRDLSNSAAADSVGEDATLHHKREMFGIVGICLFIIQVEMKPKAI